MHEDYAVWLALNGRFDDAVADARLAESLEPQSARAFWIATLSLRWARRCDEAIAEAQRGLAVQPTFGPIHHELGVCYEARREFDRAFEEYGRSGQRSGNLGHAYAAAGRVADAHSVIDSLRTRWESTQTGAADIAQVYVGLGEIDRAFEWLARSETQDLATLKVASVWDPLRSDPRFAILLGRAPFR